MTRYRTDEARRQPDDYEGSTYDELISTLEGLPFLVRETRRRRRLSVRAAAEQVGTSFMTLSRCERGAYGGDRGLSIGITIKVLRWIAASDAAVPGPAGEKP